MKSYLRVQLAMFAMVVFGGVETAFADIQYSFATIDVPGADETAAYGINNSGQIVGWFNVLNPLTIHGFLDTGGSVTTIDYPGATAGTFAYGINNSGQIVGAFSGTSGFGKGFLYTGGSFSNIDVPGARSTQPRGINDSGQIVGYYGDASSLVTHGFLDTGGSFATIDVPGAISETLPSGINNKGQIVGSYDDASGIHGFLDTGGSFTTIDFPGAFRTFATGINDSGQIVGIYYMTPLSSGQGFLDTEGSFTTIDFPGATTSGASAINDSGQILGEFNGTHGYLATPVPQTPPAVSCSATPNMLWPPNGKPVVVTVSGTVTPGTQPISSGVAAYAVTDEYGQVQPSGAITLGSGGSYSFGVSLIAARNGDDQDGRTYTIVVGAKDVIGNLGSCSTVVTVPHDQGHP